MLALVMMFYPIALLLAQPRILGTQTPANTTPSVKPSAAPTAGDCHYTGSHTATIDLMVTPAGRPENESVAVSSGDACLDQQALKTVAGYHFQPAIRDGNPVATHLRIQINFKR